MDMIEETPIVKEPKWVSLTAILICAVAMLFYFYEFVLRISPSVMSKQLMQAYHMSPRAYGNLSAIYYYVYAPMQMVVGILLDRYGTKRLLVIAALVSAIGCYLFANGYSEGLAEFGRFIAGFGAAFAFIGVLKLLTVWLKPKYFALASGMVVVMGMLGGMFGDIGLSFLLRFEGWRLTCYWVAIAGVVIALVLCVVLRDHPAQPSNLEKVSLERFIIECLRLLRNKQIWLNGLIGCLLYLPILGFAETWQIPYLAYVMDYQHVDAAMAAATIFCGCAVAAPIVGWISDTLKQRRLPLTIGAVLATILMSSVLYMPDMSKHMMYTLLFLYGMATSVYILTFAISRDLSPIALSGTAFAITNMLVALSGLSVIFIGYVIESAWQSADTIGLHSYGVSAFQIAFMIFPIALFLAVLLTFFLEETYCRRKVVIEVVAKDAQSPVKVDNQDRTLRVVNQK